MKQRSSILPLLFAAATLAVAGCSSGGSAPSPGPTPSPTPTPTPTPPPAGSPAIQVLPTTFDFGKVTLPNQPAPLEVTIRNTGTAALRVSAIALLAPSGGPYALSLTGGSKPCGSGTPTLAVNDSCTVQVAFQPPTAGPFASTLQVSSDAQSSPVVSVPISGASELLTSVTLRINQVDNPTCPNPAIAYLSVIDQGGYPVLGLQAAQFVAAQQKSMTPPSTPRPIISVDPIDFGTYKNVAISALLDHSKSLTDQPVAFADMKTGFSGLLGGLKPNDIAELMKFATEYEVVVPFTSDSAALKAGIELPFNKGTGTRLYDTVYQAVDNISTKTTYRRAVIVATDGVDELPPSAPAIHNLQQVIDNAKSKNVPIFTIGLGVSINATDLGRMAADTGGLYYQASTSQNLATIYQQLASLLYGKQYVMKFDQLPRSVVEVTPDLLLGVSVPPSGNAVKSMTSCPP
jgi:von Willebrand factor type A domain